MKKDYVKVKKISERLTGKPMAIRATSKKFQEVIDQCNESIEQILEFTTNGVHRLRDFKLKNGFYESPTGITKHSLDEMLQEGECVDSGDFIISKVAKDKDTILNIGDNTNLGVIKSFHYVFAKIGVVTRGANNIEWIEDIYKVDPKQPLFTTNDGVDIYEDDTYYSVSTETWLFADKGKSQRNRSASHPIMWTTFSTKKKAEQYIDQNKPIYSKQQIEEAIMFAKRNDGWTVENIKKYLFL